MVPCLAAIWIAPLSDWNIPFGGFPYRVLRTRFLLPYRWESRGQHLSRSQTATPSPQANNLIGPPGPQNSPARGALTNPKPAPPVERSRDSSRRKNGRNKSSRDDSGTPGP